MNHQALSELLECSVCLEQLDDTSKVLPCQHTFCKRCLEEIISTKHELRCPECRFLVEMHVDDLPPNILLQRILEGLKTQKRSIADQNRTSRKDGSPIKGDNSAQSVAAFARQQQQRQAVNGSRPSAKAIFHYEAKEPGDLSFKKGDIVYLRKQVDENWYHGELNGQMGFFPATYVQVLTALPSSIPQCQARYDFNPGGKEEDCLAFKKDEIVTVIRKVDDNWLEGKKGDKIGIFPHSFVKLNEPAKILLRLSDKSSSSHTGPPVTPAHPGTGRPSNSSKEGSPIHVVVPQQNKRHSLTNLSQHVPLPAPAIHRRSLDSTSGDTDLLAAGGQGHGTHISLATASSSAAADIPPPIPAHANHHVAISSQHPMALSSHGAQSVATTASHLAAQSSALVAGAHANQPITMPIYGGHPVTMPTHGGHHVSMTSHGVHSVAMTTQGQPATMSTQLAMSTSHAAHMMGGPKPLLPMSSHNCIISSNLGAIKPLSDPLFVNVPVQAAVTDILGSLPPTPVYVALYSYKPQKIDELELIKGEYYSVLEKCMDGWFKGVAMKSSIAGVFPGNYVQPVKTHGSPSKSVNKSSSSAKPKVISSANTNTASGTSSQNQSPILSPPRPKTSSAEASGRVPEASGRSHGRVEHEPRTTESHVHGMGKSKASGGDKVAEGNSTSGEKGLIPAPPIVPRSPHTVVPLSSKASSVKPSSSSSPSSPVLPAGSKTTRYVRASKSTSPNISGAKSDIATPTSASSPVWKHSMPSNVNITPPNMVVGAAANTGAKEKKKEKEKMSLMKRLTLAGKSKKSKYIDGDTNSNSITETGIAHSRSGSYPCEVSIPLLPEGGHKKTGSFDSSSSPVTQHKPSRPKPLVRESYRCTETYPAQSEIELDLKIGDIIFVHKKRDDGWFKGTLQRSGKTGLFPGSFVEKCS